MPRESMLRRARVRKLTQSTCSNSAMPVLVGLGMTSAYDVMAYSEAEFMELIA